MSLCFFSLWFFYSFKDEKQTENSRNTIENSRNYESKNSRSYHFFVLPKSLKELKFISSLHNKAKNELQMYVISCTNT